MNCVDTVRDTTLDENTTGDATPDQLSLPLLPRKNCSGQDGQHPYSPISPSQHRPTTSCPEHFLPPQAIYDSLTIDLYMLGYFHILEQELTAEELKMRAPDVRRCLLPRRGFPWETVRDFHKAVLQVIQEGKRLWLDRFEDIKAPFFGTAAAHGRYHPGGTRECQCLGTRLVHSVDCQSGRKASKV